MLAADWRAPAGLPQSSDEAGRSAAGDKSVVDAAQTNKKGGRQVRGARITRDFPFTRLMDLQSTGVEISTGNDLMRECGRCLQEALSLCRLVLHRSGEEGIDELWGEPFRAFCIPLEAFYDSRYLKMAQAMRDIDRIAGAMAATFTAPMFPGIEAVIRESARAAGKKVETLRTDPQIFDIWAELVTAGERLASFTPVLCVADEHEQRVASVGTQLICNGRDLIFHITRARVSMPKSTRSSSTGAQRTAPQASSPWCPSRCLPEGSPTSSSRSVSSVVVAGHPLSARARGPGLGSSRLAARGRRATSPWRTRDRPARPPATCCRW
jgi:hypothetical protein